LFPLNINYFSSDYKVKGRAIKAFIEKKAKKLLQLHFRSYTLAQVFARLNLPGLASGVQPKPL